MDYSNWYTTREAVRALSDNIPAKSNKALDILIEGASRGLDELLHRQILGRLETHSYTVGLDLAIPLDKDLLDVVSLRNTSLPNDPVISPENYELEPTNLGPPYEEIALTSSTSVPIAPGNIIEVIGLWGYKRTIVQITKIEALDDNGNPASYSASDDLIEINNGELVEVGQTIQINGSGIAGEQLFISDIEDVYPFVGLRTTNIDQNTDEFSYSYLRDADDHYDVDTNIKVGEIIRIDEELMLVNYVGRPNPDGTVDFKVDRGYFNARIESHGSTPMIGVYRKLKVRRGINNTTPTPYSGGDLVYLLGIPGDISSAAAAMTMNSLVNGQRNWSNIFDLVDSEKRYDDNSIRTLLQSIVTPHRRTSV